MVRFLHSLTLAWFSIALGGAALVAPVPSFNSTLELQGVRFQVKSDGVGSQRQLTITTSGTRRPIPVIRRTVDGAVVGAEVSDLNANGQPELYVFVQGAGSGSDGELVAYALNIGSSLTPITLPELSGALARDYQGHDSFAVVESCLARRFPTYKSGDTNAHPTGGLRQICYKLKAGEAGWILRPAGVQTF
jgi:hypothetical protein